MDLRKITKNQGVLLEFVNSAVNVSSNMIGCLEVVPLSPAHTVI